MIIAVGLESFKGFVVIYPARRNADPDTTLLPIVSCLIGGLCPLRAIQVDSSYQWVIISEARKFQLESADIYCAATSSSICISNCPAYTRDVTK